MAEEAEKTATLRSVRTPGRLRCLAASALYLGLFCHSGAQVQSAAQEKSFYILRNIYTEVKDMGFRPGENFIQRDFFIGAPDEDDTNKDISVNIFIQAVDGAEKMRIQVTYLERTRENSKVKLAKETRHIEVIIGADAVRIVRTDYTENELPKLTEEILTAVKDKKRLLKK